MNKVKMALSIASVVVALVGTICTAVNAGVESFERIKAINGNTTI